MGAVHLGVPKEIVLWAKDAFGLKTFVETGTNRAATAVWASSHFPRVITIEGQEALYESARAANRDKPQIEFLLGNSGELLGRVLESLTEPALLWLDAHYSGGDTFGAGAECPLLDELAAVNRARHPHVVLIDDARFFLAPAPPGHNNKDWPGLLEVASALSAGSAPRFAVVHDDIIVAVPLAAREDLVGFVSRSAARANSPAAAPPSLPSRIVRRASRIGKRILRHA